MMKKIWFGVLFTLFGGMLLLTQPAQAGFWSSMGDNIGALGWWVASHTPGVNNLLAWGLDADSVEELQKAINQVSDEKREELGAEIFEKALSIPGGDAMIDEIWGDGMADRVEAYLNQRAGRKNLFPATMDEYLQEYKDACWFCSIFESMYDAINTMVTSVFNKLSKWFLSLMGLGILFLILFKVGRMVVQFQAVDVMQFLNDLFKPLGRAIIATALLGALVASNTQTVFYLITNPVMDVSLRMGESILDTTLGEVTSLYNRHKTGTDADKIVTDSLKPNWTPINQQAEAENDTAPDTALGTATKMMLVQWMKSVSSSFVVGIAMGGTFIKLGFRHFFTGGFSVFLSGIVIWLGFWILYLTFPFKIVDAFVRMAFVLTLMPLWIVLWVFPITQQYTKRAWEMLLSSCFLFVTLSVMIAIVLMLINSVVPDPLYGEDGSSISRSQFFNYLMQGYNKKASSYVSIGCGMIMNAIAFTAMGGALLSAASTIANSFIGGGGNIQTNVGDGIASSAARVGGVGVSMAKATGNLAWTGAQKVGGGIKALRSRMGRYPGGGSGGEGNAGSGGGSGGGGGTPPSGGSPNVIRGPRGERGEAGPQGERGPQGPQSENATASHGHGSGEERQSSQPASQGQSSASSATGTDRQSGANRDAFDPMMAGINRMQNIANRTWEREGIATRQAAEHEEKLKSLMNDPKAREAFIQSVGGSERWALGEMEHSMKKGKEITPEQRLALQQAIANDLHTADLFPNTAKQEATQSANLLADASPERLRAVQGLAKDEDAAGNLRKLSQDFAFIEQSMTLDRDSFRQAIQSHSTWQTSSDKMQRYAMGLYDNKGSKDYIEDRTRELLHDTYLGTAATRDTAEQISKAMADNFERNPTDRTMSNALNELSEQVADTQARNRTNRS
ncbi:MAG: hypothetical protein SPL08_04430 [Pseudomonadota bacterium]|nr:hypothetical protein [Pseudomonadota bacterium]